MSWSQKIRAHWGRPHPGGHSSFFSTHRPNVGSFFDFGGPKNEFTSSRVVLTPRRWRQVDDQDTADGGDRKRREILRKGRPHNRPKMPSSCPDPSGKSPVCSEAGVRPVKPLAQKYFCFSEVQITLHNSPSHPVRGAYHDRRIRGVGMRWTHSSA